MTGLFDIDMGLSDIVKTVASYIENPNEKAKAERAAEAQAKLFSQQIRLEQIKTNQIEAQHTSKFVSGWRPFIGWVCGVGVAWAFILQPFLSWMVVVSFGYTGKLPEPDIFNLIALLTGMLGMGTLRTYEKKNLFKK